jgi:hypothetical protein
LRGRGLAVTEATSTGVVESFTLLTPNLLETRIVSANNGIDDAICPVDATCPYPARRFARPAAELVPRRLALELALRTFLDTTKSRHAGGDATNSAPAQIHYQRRRIKDY